MRLHQLELCARRHAPARGSGSGFHFDADPGPLCVAIGLRAGPIGFAAAGVLTALQIGGKLYHERPREAWIAAGYVVGIAARSCAIGSAAIIAASGGNLDGQVLAMRIVTGSIGLA